MIRRTPNGDMLAGRAIAHVLKHIMLPIRSDDLVGHELDTPKTRSRSGRQSVGGEPMSLASVDTRYCAKRSLKSLAPNVEHVVKPNCFSSPSTTSTMMVKRCVWKIVIAKSGTGFMFAFSVTECQSTSKSFVSTAILANEETAESSSRIVVARERATTRAQARRTKRSEAPGFPKGNDDIVWTLLKDRAAPRGGIGGRDSDANTRSFFNQVCGYTPQTLTVYTGLNAVVAPSSGRRIVAGSGTADENITSSDIFTLDLIDAAVEMAKVGANMVRPIRIGGQPKYVLYLHPYQVTSMRTNSSTGQWLDIQKAAMQGGQVTNSPIYTGALGEYNSVIIRQSQDVTQGVSGATGLAITTVRRAILLGAQAAVIGYGQANYGPMKYRWNEELLDHKRKLEVSAWSIWGMKKTRFNSADFGTVLISTYATAQS